MDEVDRRAVNAVMGAFAPKPIPIRGKGQVPEQGQVELRMDVNVVCGTDEGRFAKICPAWK